MKWALTLLCCTLFGQGITVGQDAMARAHLETGNKIWVGQKLTLVVDLLAPGYFSGSPNFDLPSVPGVLIMPPEGRPVLGTEEKDGTTFTVQHHELMIFAQRAGPQEIPAFAIRFGLKRTPLQHDPVPQTVRTTAIRFTAELPPGAEKLGTVLSARNLTVKEEWTPVLGAGKAKTGDAFRRTITYTAPEVPAMLFPPFPAGRIDGLGIYPQAPQVLDHEERGALLGKRQDSITYVCQRPGSFMIPAAHLVWWDLDNQKLRSIDFPARTFQVAPNPAMRNEAPPPTRPAYSGPRIWIVILAVVLGALCFLLWRAPLLRFLRRAALYLRPVHLQPLNPTSGAGRSAQNPRDI